MTESVLLKLRLQPASSFSLETLTMVYNHARADYMVPMQMTPEAFQRYSQLHDIDKEHSVVALIANQPVGIGMLAVRPGRSWITRLGVIAEFRRAGIGEIIVRGLLEQAQALTHTLTTLEVIEGNQSGLNLFRKLGFRAQRTLVVAGRQPAPISNHFGGQFESVAASEAVNLFQSSSLEMPWTNQWETYLKRDGGFALHGRLACGTSGWLFFRRDCERLSHFRFHTDKGDPVFLAETLLTYLHYLYPTSEAHVENIPACDPHLPALHTLNYKEKFRRIVMSKSIER